MNLSKTKIALFFLTVLLLGWFLYPSEFFLAYIYEGQTELTRAESHYLKHLEQYPTSKPTTLRLANLYQRMATPEKAIPFLKKLCEHRKTDWELAMYYLTYLEDMNNTVEAYKAYLAIARSFKKQGKVPSTKIVELFDNALQYALWEQKFDEAYQILLELIPLAKNPGDYTYQLLALDRGFKKTHKLVKFLKDQIVSDPQNLDLIFELASVYLVTNNFIEAKKIVNNGLTLNSKNIDFLRLAVDIYEKLGDIKTAIKHAQTLVATPTLPHELKQSAVKRLASLYFDNKDYHKSLPLFQTILNEDPADPKNWIPVIDNLDSLERKDEFLSTLTAYVNQFPDDLIRLKILADTYLYDQKDLTKLPFYLDFLKKDPRFLFALDIAYALIEKNQRNTAQKWLNQITPLFPADRVLIKLKIENLIALKDYPPALRIIQQQLTRSPRDKTMILFGLEIYLNLADNQNIEDYLEKLAAVDPQDPQTLLFASRELFFIGAHFKAHHYAKQSLQISESLEGLYWLMEISHALENNKMREETAARLIRVARKRKLLTPDENRMWLKARGRIRFNSLLKNEYRRSIQKSPNDHELKLDLIDFLLEAQKWTAARSEITLFKQKHPDKYEDILPFVARLAIQQNDLKTARPILERLIQKSPQAHHLKIDLASVYDQQGEWPRALTTLESITVPVHQKKFLDKTIRDLRDLHDHQVYAEYIFTDLGGSRLMQGKTGFSGHLSKDFKLFADFEFVDATNASPQTHDRTGQMMLSLASDHLTNITLKLGLGAGISDQIKTPSGQISAQFNPLRNLSVAFQFDYRHLRTDLAQAISAGVLQDRVELGLFYTPWEKIQLFTRYEFNHSYLKNQARAFEHTLEPSLTFVVIKKPSLTVGYQFTWSKITDTQGFFTVVPLITGINAHYLTGQLSHDLTHKLSLGTQLFAGEDFKRNLHLFNGDLWGAGAFLKWRPYAWLAFDSSYNYGRESLSGLAGEFHQFKINLKGYWR